MSTPHAHQSDDRRQRTSDERLEAAFARYAEAYAREETGAPLVSRARLDLTLLLWDEQELPPPDVQRQLVRDTNTLLTSTPPLT